MKKRIAMTSALAAVMALGTTAPAGADDGPCQSTGAGLTANYVNEVPDAPFEVTCDVGIYLDERTNVKGASVVGAAEHSRAEQFGIYVDGADVDIKKTSIAVEDDYAGQFVSVSYRNGATGAIQQSEMTGAHRVAILLRGEGTEVSVKQNAVEGTGPKTSGQAENGIQVDHGAAASLVGNTVEGHWWDGESNFGSTGILLQGSAASRVVNNTLTDNEFGVYLVSDGNTVTSNTITSDVVSQSSLDFRAYGVLVAGSDNRLAGNRLSSSNGAVGFYVFRGVEDNRLTGNRVTGFDVPVADAGSGTVVRGMPSSSGA